ncbi:hypothetical protein LTR97_008097 [Elasticomyces elasticus]|uniref:Uncharacterized protein n=1 Tax=Elasticomyces elasticus TaxID=574655 RepID=A0AAN7W000_9PEZI|nr:hypothetical protein LTR97_008097 [Elasticomyces elasticus]
MEHCLTTHDWQQITDHWEDEWHLKVAAARKREAARRTAKLVSKSSVDNNVDGAEDGKQDSIAVEKDGSSSAEENLNEATASVKPALDPAYPQSVLVKDKYIVCDHCHSHGLPCSEEEICEQCILHGVACVHHWCKLSKNKRRECPRNDCHNVHKDCMPKSEALKGVEWLVLPGNMRGYMSAGRKGMMYDDRDRESYGGREDKYEDWELQDIKSIQEEARSEMSSCVARGVASWDTIIMACDCVANEQEENEKKLAKQMARNRRGDAFLARYE